MFDISKRGSARPSPEPVDDELEKDRVTSPSPARSASGGSETRVREAAIIGPSIHINGDLRGEEDLIIEGTVNGTIHLSDNSLTIGSNGKVKADVYAHSVYVDGTLDGDLFGYERVAIRKSGRVGGNVVSPRVSLDDGGQFKGTVEMDQQAVDKAFGRTGGANKAPSGSRADSPAAAKPQSEPHRTKTEQEPKANPAPSAVAGKS